MRRELGAFLVIAGIMLVAVSILQNLSQGAGQANYGGVILIGPVPIILGSNPDLAIESMVLAILLMALSLAFTAFLRRRT